MAYQIAFDLEESATQDFLLKVIQDLPATKKADTNEMETDEGPNDSNDDRFAKIKTILSGVESIKLHLEFLYRKNHTDLLILKNTKVREEKRRRLEGDEFTDPIRCSVECPRVTKFRLPLGRHFC
jgi:26S proteasome regulatory subunit N2